MVEEEEAALTAGDEDSLSSSVISSSASLSFICCGESLGCLGVACRGSGGTPPFMTNSALVTGIFDDGDDSTADALDVEDDVDCCF